MNRETILLLRAPLLLSTIAALVVGSTLAFALKPPAFAATARLCRTPPSAAVAGYGTVRFANTCAPASQAPLEGQIARLHSFESDASAFAAIAARDPSCGIALWGAAMSARGNPLGGVLDAASLAAGHAYVERALAVKTVSAREAG